MIGNSHKHQLAEIANGRASVRTSNPGLANLDRRFRFANPDKASCRWPTDDESERPYRSPIFVSDIFAHTELQAAPVFDAANERTRPNLKVQDGCDNRCSFCVIPYVRGQSRSLNLAEVSR